MGAVRWAGKGLLIHGLQRHPQCEGAHTLEMRIAVLLTAASPLSRLLLPLCVSGKQQGRFACSQEHKANMGPELATEPCPCIK